MIDVKKAEDTLYFITDDRELMDNFMEVIENRVKDSVKHNMYDKGKEALDALLMGERLIDDLGPVEPGWRGPLNDYEPSGSGLLEDE